MKYINYIFVLIFVIVTSVIDTNKHGITNEINTCLPENQNNKSLVDKAITNPVWAYIWQRNNITGVTPQNVDYVLSSDSKCSALLTKYHQTLNRTLPNSSLKSYTVTFHKYQNYYFVMILLNDYPNMLTSGTSPFHILDNDLNDLDAIAL